MDNKQTCDSKKEMAAKAKRKGMMVAMAMKRNPAMAKEMAAKMEKK